MPQRSRHSIWEVGVDFGLGTTCNLCLQALVLRTFTLPRGLGFTSVYFLLALLRRYGTRRGFNCFVRTGQTQTWRMSLFEVLADTGCAIVIVFALLELWYADESFARLSSFVGVAYMLTPLWRFILRRFFAWLPGTMLGWRAMGR